MAAMFLLFIVMVVHSITGDRLEQVVVLSRHNIRTPLVLLNNYTRREWLKWSGEPGFLTTKGSLLEEYLGEHFAEWLVQENLITEECPNDYQVHVYANVHQRTRKTAEHFTKSAFKMCNITIHYEPNVESDPVFIPAITSDSESFQTEAREQMQTKLDSLHFDGIYDRINTILDIKNSDICRHTGMCDLKTGRINISLIFGDQPRIYGPFQVGSEVADTFLMAYYDGEYASKIGWGEIRPEDWKPLLALARENLNVRFGCPTVAKQIARPLLNFIKQEFLEDKHSVTFLFGHDSNIRSVLASIGVAPYTLEGQNETTPIGGKVIFEKWSSSDGDYLKINYLYLSMEQIRNGARITRDNPPHVAALQLKDVSGDVNGHHPFSEFMNILENITDGYQNAERVQ